MLFDKYLRRLDQLAEREEDTAPVEIVIVEEVIEPEHRKATPSPVVTSRESQPPEPGIVARVVDSVRKVLAGPDPAQPRDNFALALRDLSVDELNARVRSPLTPQQRNAVDDELNRRQRVRNQLEQPAGAYDADLLRKDDGNASRWDEGSITGETLH